MNAELNKRLEAVIVEAGAIQEEYYHQIRRSEEAEIDLDVGIGCLENVLATLKSLSPVIGIDNLIITMSNNK